MKTYIDKLWPISALLLIFSLSACGPTVNSKLTIEVSGPCEECPQARLDSLLKTIEGVVHFEFANGNMILDVDSTVVSKEQLASALNQGGYDLDMKLGVKPNDVLCCKDPLETDIDDEDSDIINDDLDDPLAGGLDEELDDNLFDDTEDIGDLDEQLNDEVLLDDEDIFGESAADEKQPKPKKKKK